jgi:hypothetical protein
MGVLLPHGQRAHALGPSLAAKDAIIIRLVDGNQGLIALPFGLIQAGDRSPQPHGQSPEMKIPTLPFTVTDWSTVPVTEHAGEQGKAYWRTLMIGDIRVRQVEYTPGYVADHWCDRGHILLVLEGELESELKDGRKSTLSAGMGYQVSDFGDAAHRSSTPKGARLFIVD